MLFDPLQVALADNGQAAVDSYKKLHETLEVVLMDIHMPGMDGTEATEKIREWEEEQGLEPKVILGLTGNVDEGDITHDP